MYTVKAIRKDNQEWISGYLWQGSNYAGIIPHNLGVNIANNRIEAVIYEVDVGTICEPANIETYWYDKNGGHIYPVFVNDILEFDIGTTKYKGRVTREFDKLIVKIDGCEDAFVELTDLKKATDKFIHAKILGNVHDKQERTTKL